MAENFAIGSIWIMLLKGFDTRGMKMPVFFFKPVVYSFKQCGY